MGKRISAHKIEVRAKDIVRKAINNFETTDGKSMLFREITERDYGIDALIELFENENPTGKIAFLQIKGKQHKIIPKVTKPEVSCSITSSNLYYGFQENIPVILIYVSIENPQIMYFLDIQSQMETMLVKINKKNPTINIPVENIISDEDLSLLIDIVQKYYCI